MSFYSILSELQIPYQMLRHYPVYTIEEAKLVSQNIAGLGCKCLFLKAKKAYYLLLAGEDTPVDLKALGDILGIKRLHLASPEDLLAILGCTPGAVTPLLLANCAANASAGDPANYPANASDQAPIAVTFLVEQSLAGKDLLVHGEDNRTFGGSSPPKAVRHGTIKREKRFISCSDAGDDVQINRKSKEFVRHWTMGCEKRFIFCFDGRNDVQINRKLKGFVRHRTTKCEKRLIFCFNTGNDVQISRKTKGFVRHRTTKHEMRFFFCFDRRNDVQARRKTRPSPGGPIEKRETAGSQSSSFYAHFAELC